MMLAEENPEVLNARSDYDNLTPRTVEKLNSYIASGPPSMRTGTTPTSFFGVQYHIQITIIDY